jgi:hypothetical protein
MLLGLLTACGSGVSTGPPPLAPLPKVDKLPAYKVIGRGPLVVVLAMDMQQTLTVQGRRIPSFRGS